MKQEVKDLYRIYFKSPAFLSLLEFGNIKSFVDEHAIKLDNKTIVILSPIQKFLYDTRKQLV